MCLSGVREYFKLILFRSMSGFEEFLMVRLLCLISLTTAASVNFSTLAIRYSFLLGRTVPAKREGISKGNIPLTEVQKAEPFGKISEIAGTNRPSN